MPPEQVGIVRDAEHRHRAKVVPLSQKKIADLGLADASRILQHCVEHWLQFAGRRAYDAQHFRSRRLLLQRLCEVTCALAQFVEQPRVLDGDDRLGGEILHQPICLSVKGRTS